MKKSDSGKKFKEIYIEDHFKQPQDGVDGTLYNDDPENALKEDYIDNPQQEQNVNDDYMSHSSGHTVETEYTMADFLGSDYTLSTRANFMTDLNISQSNSNELSDSKSNIDSSKSKQSFTDRIMDSRSNNSKDKGSGRC